jgi:hypothetical protein
MSASATAVASNRDGHAVEALCMLPADIVDGRRRPYGSTIRQHQDRRSAGSRGMLNNAE